MKTLALLLSLLALDAGAHVRPCRAGGPRGDRIQHGCNSGLAYATFYPSGPQASDECTGNALTLSDGTAITSTRSSSATCHKSDGSIVTLTTNQPRLEGGGVRREAAATNLALRSEACDNAAWTHNTLCAADQATAPDGNVTAEQMTFSSQNTSAFQTLSFSSSTTATGSAFWKTHSGQSDQVVSVAIDMLSGVSTCTCATSDGRSCTPTNPVNTFCGATMTTSSTWARLYVFASNGGARTSANFILRLGALGSTVTGTADVWGAQFEGGPVASSYIATAGTSVTRNADSLSFTVPGQLLDSEGCVKATVFTRAIVTPAVWLGMTGYAYQDTSTLAKTNDSTNTVSATAGSSTLSRAVVLSAGWRSSNSSMRVSNDGVINTGTYDGTWTPAAAADGGTGTVYLGGKSDGTGPLNGFINKLSFYTSQAACP